MLGRHVPITYGRNTGRLTKARDLCKGISVSASMKNLALAARGDELAGTFAMEREGSRRLQRRLHAASPKRSCSLEART